MKKYTALSIAIRVHTYTVLLSSVAFGAVMAYTQEVFYWEFLLACVAIFVAGGIPGALLLMVTLFILSRRTLSFYKKWRTFVSVCLAGVLLYSFPGALFTTFALDRVPVYGFLFTYFLFLGVFAFIMAIALIFVYRPVCIYFSSHPDNLIKKTHNMEKQSSPEIQSLENATSNRILIKGVITGVLILCMLIPVVYISDLVREREQRQQEVANEVSGRWASAQTLSGPFLYIPYQTTVKLANGSEEQRVDHLWLTPDQLKVDGTVEHEFRERSIYKVLLYRAKFSDTGRFVLNVPSSIEAARFRWNEARICFGVSDFKGIEERLSVHIGAKELELSPGLPADDLVAAGLSAPIDLSGMETAAELPFTMNIRIRGSRQLHFLPLGGNSSFTLKSTWPDPSFDGNTLPGERIVTPEGFLAKWTFNKANLPFGTTLQNLKGAEVNGMGFGVTMLEPADHYAKTSRSVKYAILFVGLTFALFFIIELMQKKPFHPVQYVLTGLALIIFYSLLLSISEFIPFDQAYGIAAAAIVIMITLYAFSHFRKWSAALLFFGVLSTFVPVHIYPYTPGRHSASRRQHRPVYCTRPGNVREQKDQMVRGRKPGTPGIIQVSC